MEIDYDHELVLATNPKSKKDYNTIDQKIQEIFRRIEKMKLEEKQKQKEKK